MKRVVSFFIIFILVLSLVGCGKSEMVLNTEEAISSIGDVSIDSLALIEAAENSYQILSEKEKQQVENRTVLIDARSKYNELLAKQEEEKKQLEKDIESIREAILACDVATIKELCDKILPQAEKLGDTETSKLVRDLKEKLPEMCYGSTPLMKLENVISINPMTIEEPVLERGTLFYVYVFRNYSDVATAYKEYKSYISKYYTLDHVTDDSKAYFKTENGKEILMFPWTIQGDEYYLNLNFDKEVLE